MKIAKLSALTILVTLATNANASLVNDNIDYQYFRNFAENKGKFKVGATNIPVYDKQGKLLGTALPKDIPMPDFSAVDSNRYLSGLIGNQYLASVKHNSNAHFVGTRFGQDNKDYDVYAYQYNVVDRNDHSEIDYNTPRLNKMVTEVAPAELPQNFSVKDLLNGRYIAFARMGSGTQATQDESSITIRHNAYKIPTGGTPLRMSNNVGDMVSTIEGNVAEPKTSTGPMVSYAAKGDSGSPLWGFDKELRRWVLIGHVAQYYGWDYIKNNYMITQNNFYRQNQLDDTSPVLNVRSVKPIYWENSSEGKSVIKSELNQAEINVKKGNDLNHGKDVIIKGQNTTLQLNENINQGAGGLYFLNSATVKGVNSNITHVGSGVYVYENQTVHWQVKNPKNDRLSKLGRGILIVDGTGDNTGDISVGDGTVYLSQNGGTAFNTAHLASGRGKIVLKDANQAKYYQFDYRGGTLDVNGNNLTFDTIRHVDNGARIVNENRQKESTITLNPKSDKYYLGDFGTLPQIYSKLNSGKYNQSGLGSIDINDFVNNDGQLNVRLLGDKTYTMQGNTNIKGNVSVLGRSTLIYKGTPTPYADIVEVNKRRKVEMDDDWENRSVNANQFIVSDNAKLQFDRNLTSVNGNIIGNNQAQIQLGSLTNKQVKTNAQGQINLNDTASMVMGDVHFTGSLNNAVGTNLSLSENTLVTLDANSQVGNLAMQKGSQIQLNPDKQFKHFNTLTVNGALSGNGFFRFSMDLASLAANKLLLKGDVSGDHIISLLDSGREPTSNNGSIRLIEVDKANQQYSFTLDKNFVDAGAYRYEFNNGLLTAEKQNTIKDGPIDPNYKRPDFSDLSDEFKNQTTQSKIKTILTETNNRILSYDELLERLKNKGLINAKLDDKGNIINPDKEGDVYDLSKLTPEDREKLRGNGEDLSKIDPDKLTDKTPTPKVLGETKLYDVQTAKEDGLTVLDGKIVDNKDDFKPLDKVVDVKPLPKSDEPKLDEPKTNEPKPQIEIKQGQQKDKMSRYSNAALNNVALQSKMINGSVNALNHKIIDEKGDNVWVNYDHEQFKSNSDYFRDGKGTLNLVQIGASKKLGDNTILGGVFTESRSVNDTSDNIKQKQTMRTGDVFVKQNMGVAFVGANFGLGKIKNKEFGNQSLIKTGLLLGANLTWNNTVLTPYINGTYYKLNGKSYQQEGANINLPKQNIAQYGAGFDIAHNVNVGDVVIQPVFGVSYISSEKQKSAIVNQHKFTTQFENSVMTNYGFKVKADNMKFSLLGKSEFNKEFKRNHGIHTSIEFVF